MIFPQLAGKDAAYVNLNSLAIDWLAAHPQGPDAKNPLIDPVVCQSMVEAFHAQEKVSYSYGGYLEDRSTVWRDSYLTAKGMFLHLAVDVNAPVGTEVAIDRDAEVVFTGNDTPLVGGWGSFVIFKLDTQDLYILYAHLASDIGCALGEHVKAGTVFAKVGAPQDNGHWYSHVHIQMLTPEAYKAFQEDAESLDGYGEIARQELLAERFPDPMMHIEV